MKLKIVLLLSVLMLCACIENNTMAQNNSKPQEAEFFTEADKMPEPVGGIEAIMQKIVYPEIAKRAGIEGKIYVETYIDEKGDVVNTKIIKGIGQDAGMDESAMDAIKLTKFKPAVNKGIPVKSKVTIPVLFRLDGNKPIKI